MEVHFHSDASNNDWGVRLSAYGILQVRSFDRLFVDADHRPRDKCMALRTYRTLASAKRFLQRVVLVKGRVDMANPAGTNAFCVVRARLCLEQKFRYACSMLCFS